MKTSASRILTTHVGSIPRPEEIRALLRARLSGEHVDEEELSGRVKDAVTDVVRRQVEAGIDVVSDGEMSKTSFIGYTDERLTGFTQVNPGDPAVPASNTGGSWARRVDTRHEWRAFRDYSADYLPRAMPPSAPPTVCTGPITYKGHDLLRRCRAQTPGKHSCLASPQAPSAGVRTSTMLPRRSTVSPSPRP